MRAMTIMKIMSLTIFWNIWRYCTSVREMLSWLSSLASVASLKYARTIFIWLYTSGKFLSTVSNETYFHITWKFPSLLQVSQIERKTALNASFCVKTWYWRGLMSALICSDKEVSTLKTSIESLWQQKLLVVDTWSSFRYGWYVLCLQSKGLSHRTE